MSLPPPRRVQFDPVPHLHRFLGANIVLIQCQGKKPQGKWGHLRTEHMTPEYLAKLKLGNIGVPFGDVSDGLCVIDIDADEFVQPFQDANPSFAETFQTRGRRGQSFWFRLVGTAPRSRKISTKDGTPVGEFRSNGNYSIAWGTHPDSGKPYTWLVSKPVIEIELDSIHWPEGWVNPFSPSKSPLENLPKGASAKGGSATGDATKGGPPLSMLGLGWVGGVGALPGGAEISETARAEIEKAVELGAQSTKRNNAASFDACLALIRLRGVSDLSDMPPAERRYFAECWYRHLNSLGRTNPERTKTHYYSDIINSIKNAKASATSKNPIPQAWLLAQSEPLPPEAATFEGDEIMQKLIALCYQLHKLNHGGEWFIARNKVGELMGLDETGTRNLSENFHVLVDCGILVVVKPYEKGKRQATTYRYIQQGLPTQEPPEL
jgi:hypothetical protein